MNKMTRVLLLLISLLAVAFTANAANTPTAIVKVCVTLQGNRALTQGEPVDWKLYNAGTSVVAYLPSDTGDANPPVAIPPSAGTKGCFDVIGVPNTVYDLYIKGADHLARMYPNWSYPAGGSFDLPADSHKLLEGDANGDNFVRGSDTSIYASSLNVVSPLCEGATGYNSAADFNEDKCVRGSDGSLLVGNLNVIAPIKGASLPVVRSATTIDKITTPNGVAIGFTSGLTDSHGITPTVGITFTVPVYADFGNTGADTVRVAIKYDPAFVTMGSLLPVNFDQNFGGGNPTGEIVGLFGRSLSAGGAAKGIMQVANVTFSFSKEPPVGFQVLSFTPGDAANETGTISYVGGAPSAFTTMHEAVVLAPSSVSFANLETTSVNGFGLVALTALVGMTTYTVVRRRYNA